MTVTIFDHAVENYFRRVEDREPPDKTHPEWIRARQKLRESIRDRDFILKIKEDKPPLYIKGKIAMPLDKNKDGYDNPVVPTVYTADVFMDKITENEYA